ncbi:hypothetical protein [Octadecabacter arcticus]|uniref:hypothetical protein n=1 Tax=Octadecabacter arcticus TaxID=53946 RepID=UPI0005C4DA1A|nr:hypothetical protein [Octadecabacter arcticus]
MRPKVVNNAAGPWIDASHIAGFPANRLVADAPEYSIAEIDRTARTERVKRLEDVILRRSLIAVVVSAALGRNEQRIAQEICDTMI